jgi:hypothetical protein
LGLKQSRRESAVRGKRIKFQSECITADLCPGVAIAGVNTLIGADCRIRVSGPPQLATDQPQPGEVHSKRVGSPITTFREAIRRSPDTGDTFITGMFFELLKDP